MKLLLTSNFVYTSKYLKKFFDLTKKHKALFVWYANEDEFVPDENGGTQTCLRNMNFDIDYIDENYEFKDDIDLIYVKGGNTTKLIHYLKKYNQFEKLKEMVEQGVVYVGQSAGSVLAGSDTEWTLRSEPYEYDLKKLYGQDALKGFGFVNKMIFVHCSKYRFPFGSEIAFANKSKFRVTNTLFYGSYLQDKKRYQESDYIVLGDNQVLFVNDKKSQKLTVKWSDYPVLDEFKLH